MESGEANDEVDLAHLFLVGSAGRKMLRSKCCACIASVIVFCGVSVVHPQSNSVEVTSPNHRIAVHFDVQLKKGQAAGQDGQIVYSVSFKGKQVFEESALRLELANQPALGAAVHIAGSTPGSGVDDYALEAGKVSTIHDKYNSLVVHAAEGTGQDVSSMLRHGSMTTPWLSDITFRSSRHSRDFSLCRRIQSFVL